MVDQATPDAATLAAVTAFLRDCELSIDCLTQDDSSPSWSPAAENGKARGFERRDQYRRKVENERQMLQRQERELSRMLKRLQDARSREKQQEKESYTMALSVGLAPARAPVASGRAAATPQIGGAPSTRTHSRDECTAITAASGQ